jgi:hypothetical protein
VHGSLLDERYEATAVGRMALNGTEAFADA